MNIQFYRMLRKPIPIVIFFISIISLNNDYLSADYYSEDTQIDQSTKLDSDPSTLPTNPFEIVEMIRRANSMNDATDPSDALDEALNSFHGWEENQ